MAHELFRVGLTGGIGAGKSTVAELWRSEGVEVIDLDALSRAVLDKPGASVEETIARFGPQFRAADGTIDRSRLATLVFSDEQARRDLEAIVLTRVWEEVHAREAAMRGNIRGVEADGTRGSLLVVHDSPLLFEKGTAEKYRAVVAVLAPKEQRIQRVMATRGKTREYVEAVMGAQVDDAERREHADLLILNYGSREDLEARARDVLSEVRAAAAAEYCGGEGA